MVNDEYNMRGQLVRRLYAPSQSKYIRMRSVNGDIREDIVNMYIFRSLVAGGLSRASSQCLLSSPRSKPKYALHLASISNSIRRMSLGQGDAKFPKEFEVGSKRFADFDLAGRTYVVTGGAQGLGLALAEGLVEAGGKGKLVHCCSFVKKTSVPKNLLT